MISHDIQQGTPEWFEVRKGKMTASKASTIATAGKGLDTYVREILSEAYSSGEVVHFSNSHTERGNELEPLARDLYELTTGERVQEVGFIEGAPHYGCSPDGLVDADGLIEIKCPSDKKYLDLLVDGTSAINSSYLWQMQMQLLVTERKWCDFVAYNPNFPKPLFIYRVYRDETMQAKLRAGLEKGRELMESYKKELSNHFPL